MHDYEDAKRTGYLERAIDLYRRGEHFDCGALVLHDPELESRYIAAVEGLTPGDGVKVRFGAFGFGYGHASFLDFVVSGERGDEPRPGPGTPDEGRVVFAMLCSYLPMYVLGEVKELGGGAFVLPSYSGVDRFSSSRTAKLARTIASQLKGHGLPRAYADELRDELPPGFGLESNLIRECARVFDAYFNWND